MPGRTSILLVGATVGATALAILLLGGGREESNAEATAPSTAPSVQVISPRNGARQTSHAVVVKVDVHNLRLAPGHFGGEPQLGEGNIRFGLNRVPDCVDPVKLKRAIESPFGKGRLVGKSFDFPRFAGPNGVLAERIRSAGSYSPATRPEIFYNHLRSGFYRLVIVLAENDGTPYHAVTNFQLLSRSGYGPKCTGAKVPSAKAAAFG
jgi:hypothetical protein